MSRTYIKRQADKEEIKRLAYWEAFWTGVVCATIFCAIAITLVYLIL